MSSTSYFLRIAAISFFISAALVSLNLIRTRGRCGIRAGALMIAAP